MTDSLERVKVRWADPQPHRPEYWADLASRDVPRLIQEVERLQRFEAMWEDCVKHRNQAESRAARYRQMVRGVVDLLVANDEAGYP